MTFSHPDTVRDALITARSLMGKPTLSWSTNRPLENRSSGTLMIPEGYEIIEPPNSRGGGNVVLKVRFTYDNGITWGRLSENWYMVNWSFQTVADWEAENSWFTFTP